jgi:hypothetical protein
MLQHTQFLNKVIELFKDISPLIYYIPKDEL